MLKLVQMRDFRMVALALTFTVAMGEKNSASAWRGTMAPRQLRLEPIEADSTADKGAKRVRVDSTEERELNTGTKIPPARQPDARPGLHRALLPSADHTCQSSGSRHGM